MDISLNLKPYVSDQYSLETNFLRMPVSFTYEDRDGSFVHNITGGLPVIGKPHPETKIITYCIGENCSIDQLTTFIGSLSKNLPCSITFSENEEFINMIEYDPVMGTWKHVTGSKNQNYGSAITMRVSDDTVRKFRLSFEGYRRFAFMAIEGHRKLAEDIIGS